ncbi:MAG TPA: GNAT family N-acetyltransferase [Gaiellaceae bacterium]|nr:GNAT family N-acetyltransferase [Gaiellaceae bacterium]
MAVTRATTVSDELVAAFARLVPQLSSSAQAPTRAELEEVVASPATTILLAHDDVGAIIGSLTLAVFLTPTGRRAWIEDVVVDEAARGQGTGEALVNEAIRLAAELGARTVDLTSRPSRTAANALYEKIGFRRRETNVYRYEPS